MSTVHFARVNFETKLHHFSGQHSARNEIDRRMVLLQNVINYDRDLNALLEDTDQSNKRKLGEWRFAGVDTEGDVISGKLGKGTEDITQVRDDSKRDYIEIEQDDADICFFAIDVSSSIMAYEFRRNIGKKAPYRILEAVFNSYYEGEETISASQVTDKEELRRELKTITKITNVKLSQLHPSNPHSTDQSEAMDQFLRDGNVDVLNLEGRSQDGISLNENAILDGGVSLAEEGYGTATIVGEDLEGNERRVSTEDKLIEEQVQTGDDDSVSRNRLVASIQNVLRRLDE